MFTWIILLLINLSGTMTIDFGANKTNSWFSVNDTVMGGQSAGRTSYEKDALLFAGDVSFENNGGFASVRSDYGRMDLSKFEKVVVKYRCEGQSLSLNFNTDRRWWYPNYKATLPETKMEWQTVTVALKDLKEYRVGQVTGRKISMEKLSDIIRLGIMTNDKKEGPFQAEIDYIEFQ